MPFCSGCTCHRIPCCAQSLGEPHTIVSRLFHACLLALKKPFAFYLFTKNLELPVFISSAFAQTAAVAGADAQSSLMSMLPLVLMFVVLYFVMIRPQMKKAKDHKSMVESLAKGDEVVTAGGLLGKVAKLGDSYLGLEIADGVEVQIQRSAVVQVLPKGSIK
jgi:preprotein translocase subunit YajC